jgi:hypothetical protein
MIEMTAAARERLDNYFERMRAELRGTRSVVAEEVEQSVREHIEIALAGSPSPVGATEVIGVLDRLGAPERWLADEDRPVWRRVIAKLRSGPDDWRLAYLSFGLFLASIVFLPIGGFLLLLPAMLVSRASYEIARSRGESLGPRAWLIYPAIAMLLALITGLLLIGPPIGIMAAGLEEIDDVEGFAYLFDVPQTVAGQLRFVGGMGGVVFGGWWIIFAAFCAAFLRPIRFAFAPILENLGRKHFAVLALIGALVATVGGTLIYYRH